MARYHVIHHSNDKKQTPFAVVRDGEAFGHDLRWRPTDLMTTARPSSYGDWTAVWVSAFRARQAIRQIQADVRRVDQAKWINTTYRYYAHDSEVVRAKRVATDTVTYERFTDDGRWAPAGELDGELAEVGLDDVEEFKALRHGQVEPEPPRPVPPRTVTPDGAERSRFAIAERGDRVPLAIIQTNYPYGGSRELIHTPTGLNWEESALLSQIATGQYDWTVRPVSIKQINDTFFAMTGSAHRASESAWLRTEFKYYFFVDDEQDKSTVYALARTKRRYYGVGEEILWADGQWRRSDRMGRADRGSGDSYIEVTAADVRRYRAGYYRRSS